MKYKLFIPCCQQVDQLQRAIDSLGGMTEFVEVIDNTRDGIGDIGVSCRRPSLPLSFVQTQNWIQNIAIEEGLDTIIWMHDDAYFSDSSAFSEFVSHVQDEFEKDGDWGVLFTLYDLCCAYNVRAVKQVGPWDEAFQHYVSDSDWYYRVRLAGYVTRDVNEVHNRIRHDSSQTVVNNPWYKKRAEMVQNFSHVYYAEKWGGSPGEEKYFLSFDGKPRREWLTQIRMQEMFRSLSEVFYTCEGNLLEVTDDQTSLCQTEIIEQYIRLAKKPGKKLNVLETGTNKGMFALLVENLGGGDLWTHDCDPQTIKIAEVLQRLKKTKVTYVNGVSQDTLGRFKTEEYKGFFDLFWVDGGHDLDPCTCDLQNAVRLEVPFIIIDDGNMDTVQQGIRDVLESDPNYVESPNGLYDHDPRKLRAFRRRSL